MATDRRTFFIPAPPVEAYEQWKSYWGLSPEECETTDRQTQLIEDVPNQGVRWLARWGLARIDGRANFIPADGGCVLYLALNGIGAVSKLLLSSPLERRFWRTVDKFRPAAEAARQGSDVGPAQGW